MKNLVCMANALKVTQGHLGNGAVDTPLFPFHAL